MPAAEGKVRPTGLEMRKKTGNLGRPPDRICKRCGKGKVRPEMNHRGRWYYPRDKVCRNCEKELYG